MALAEIDQSVLALMKKFRQVHGLTYAEAAEALNRRGYLSPAGRPWTQQTCRLALIKRGILVPRKLGMQRQVATSHV